MRLGRFRLGDVIARGAQGEVWRAEHVPTGGAFAVKVWTADPDGAALEVLALARLEHPCVVRVHDFGVVTEREAAAQLPAGARWVAMDLVDGGSLRSRARSLDEADLHRVLTGVLDGLAHAHACDVLHLDVKPGNVLLRSAGDLGGGVCLTDFGISRVRGRAGGRGFTRGYAPPEQVEDHPEALGPWTDVFAVGQLARRLARDPGPLADWIEQATRDAPSDRFPDAARARAALPDAVRRRTWYPRPPPEPALGPALLRHRLPVLHGRTGELSRLRDAHETLRREGVPALVAVTGPPGAGVTALVDTFARAARELGEGPSVRVASEGDPAGLSALDGDAPCLVLADVPRGPPAGWPAPRWTITVGRLSRGVLRAVVRSWLPLTDAAVETLLEHADGLPGRAHAALCRAAFGGRLVAREGGRWSLRGGRARAMDPPADERRLLDLADAWGAPIEEARWAGLARALGLEGEAFVRALVGLAARGEVVARGATWLRRDPPGDVPPEVGALVLDALPADAAVRRVRLQRAIDPSAGYAAAAATAAEVRPAEALGCWREAERCLDALGASPTDPRRWDALRGQVVAAWRVHDVSFARKVVRRWFDAAAGVDEEQACKAAANAVLLEPLGSAAAEAWVDAALARARTPQARARVLGLSSMQKVAQRKPREAEAAARASLAAHPAFAVESWCQIGHAADQEGRVDDARDAYLEALRLDPGNPLPVASLGDLLKRSGRLDEARAVYLAGLASLAADRPRLPVAVRLSLAHLHLVSGDVPACVEQVALLEADVPDAVGDLALFGHLLLAACAARSGDLDEARRRFGLFDRGARRSRGGLGQHDVLDTLRRLRDAVPDGPFAAAVAAAGDRLRA